MRVTVFAAAVLLTAAACTNTGSQPLVTTSVVSTSTTGAGPDTPECLSGELPFVENGVVAVLDSEGRDARAIGDIRWISSDTCERIEVTFLSDAGSPASSLGPVDVSILPDSGIVRVSLSDVITESSVADATLDGNLVGRWYVVDGLGDGLVLDLHLNGRAAARAFSTTSPARLVIDMIPTDDDRPITPAVADGGIVLLSPQPGVGLYPLEITGYSAPNVTAVRVRLTDQMGVAFDRSISTLSPAYVWHAFGLTLDDGPSGSVELFAGTVDESDEPTAGVSIPIDLP